MTELDIITLGGSLECKHCSIDLTFECQPGNNIILVTPCPCITRDIQDELDNLKFKVERARNALHKED